MGKNLVYKYRGIVHFSIHDMIVQISFLFITQFLLQEYHNTFAPKLASKQGNCLNLMVDDGPGESRILDDEQRLDKLEQRIEGIDETLHNIT